MLEIGRMHKIIPAIVIYGFAIAVDAQIGVQAIMEAERSFSTTVGEKGAKAAFIEFLTDDAVIFRPEAVNGKQFWQQHGGDIPVLRRTPLFADAASNGLLGYTTGSWQSTRRDKGIELVSYGDYVTLWERRNGNGFRAILDIGTSYDEPASNDEKLMKPPGGGDSNKYGWSPTDVAMKFLRVSMEPEGLAAAYKEFAGDDIRLMIDREPAVYGRKAVIAKTKRFRSTKFPFKLAMFQSADMAYFWNPCRFQNSDEGIEHGNCLQILKLRNKKWYIVLGVFSRITDNTPPELRIKDRSDNRR